MIQTKNKRISKIVTIMAIFLGISTAISTALIGCKPEVTQPVLRGTAVSQSTISITNENAAKLQELASWSLDGHVRWSGGIVFAPDDQMLAVSFDDVAEILLLDTNNGNEIQILSGHADDVNSVSFSADGSQLASSSWDKTVKVWDLATGEITHSFDHPDTAYSAAFSLDGESFVSASFDGTIRVWDTASGDVHHVLTSHTGSVWDLVFSPDKTRAPLASSDGTIRLWDVSSWQELNSLKSTSAYIPVWGVSAE